jgi:predicted GIY-YIG superfamily endonuclease
MYIVYGLEDQRNHEVFYVGITDDVQSRFLQHLRCDGSNPLKDARIQAMVTAGYLPLPRTLQIVGDIEQAKRRESYWIRHYHALDMPLTNQVIPVIQEHVIIVRGKEPVDHLRPRMSLDAQRAYVNELYSQGISKEDVLQRVKKYIAPHIVNAVFRIRLTAQSDDVTVEQVKAMREQGYTQNEIILMLWHVRKGGGARYLQARERYREIVAQLAESIQ